MREGSLEAPMRHPLAWRDPEFYDEAKLDAEVRRAFDICHGCRRCFNLCDSFPRLFDLVDNAATGELDAVASADFKKVVDACTLCDMCFMTKCPYVPPHEFNLDIPHLMLRYRAVEARKGKTPWVERQLTETDRNGVLGAAVAPVANWATTRGNALTRPLLERIAHVHRDAALPRYEGKTLVALARDHAPPVNREAPAFGRKAVLFATCFANFNSTGIGVAAQAVLAKNGVEVAVSYPECCGMPQLEHGEIARVADKARRVARALKDWIDKGYDVVSLIPSCTLMLKFEWPLILPEDNDVKRLAGATFDVSEYVIDIAKNEGLAPGLKPLDGRVALHVACHARAQNMGQKGADMLKLVPGIELAVSERCSGHGGSWGVLKDNFPVALKVGRPVARQVHAAGARYVVSECPLAREHVIQGLEALAEDGPVEAGAYRHPIELLARAYSV